MNEQKTNEPTCQCGCGRPVGVYKRTDATAGQIKGQPKRFLTGHHRRLSPVDYIEDPDTGCWIWQRATLSNGYGVVGGRTTAHRAYYERHVGPVPDGWDVHHKCSVRACVNPDHLEAMGRRPHRRLDRRTKLTLETARQIKAQPNVDSRVLAARYGISREMIYHIRQGIRWPDA